MREIFLVINHICQQATDLAQADALREYMIYGGMPQVVLKSTQEEKANLLSALFERVYFRDIILRYRIKSTEVLDELVNILASSIGGLTNITKLANTFVRVKHINVSRNTLANYIEYV